MNKSLGQHLIRTQLNEKMAIKTSETVRGAEYDALYEQYVELQKELEERNVILQAERAATPHIRSESGLLKAELEVRSFPCSEHYLADTRSVDCPLCATLRVR